MYFDPVSSWLVVLIINGVELAEEKIGGRIAQSRSEREYIKERNKWMNAEISKLRVNDGLEHPEDTLRKIRWVVEQRSNAGGEIVIPFRNQDYIIALLEECAKKYSEYTYQGAQEKAEWYKKAASEAKQKREQHMKQLKEKKEATPAFDAEANAEANANGLALVITAAFVAFILVIAWII